MTRPSTPFLCAVVALLALAAGIALIDVHPSRVYADGHDWIFGAPPVMSGPSCPHPTFFAVPAGDEATIAPDDAAPPVDAALAGLGPAESRRANASGAALRW